MGSARFTFEAEADFEALHAAEAFAAECGFSVGSTQRSFPTGLMFGDYDIAKWRNLSKQERGELHGQITGDHRYGPVHVVIFSHAPAEAWARYTTAVKSRGQDVRA